MSHAAWLDAHVREKRQIADLVMEFVLVPAADNTGFERWTPGAHVDVKLGSGVIRQYSLCGRAQDSRSLTIAVLRQPAGRGGSVELHDEIVVGSRVHVSQPRNNFELVPAKELVFLAGGIGITPILPMVRAVAEKGDTPWRLIYGGRSRNAMAYADELEALGKVVQLVPEDISGLVDLEFLTELSAGTVVYVCGPQGLIDAVKTVMKSSPAGLHFERFSASSEREMPHGGLDCFEVQIGLDGEVVPVGDGDTVLDAVLTTSAAVEYSCEEGTCGTCMTRVLQGRPFHRDNTLTDPQRAEGFMLICVSGSQSQRLILDL